MKGTTRLDLLPPSCAPHHPVPQNRHGTQRRRDPGTMQPVRPRSDCSVWLKSDRAWCGARCASDPLEVFMPSSPIHRRRPRRRWHQPCGPGNIESCIADALATWDNAALHWSAVEDQLAHCAITALRNWCRDGSIYTRVRRASRKRLHLTGEQLSDSERLDELIGTIVAVSLHHFRRTALNDAGWPPRHHIDVLAHFLGHCLLTFPSEHQRWVRTEFPSNAPPIVPLHHAVNIPASDPMSRPADLAIALSGLHRSTTPLWAWSCSCFPWTSNKPTDDRATAVGSWQISLAQDHAQGHAAWMHLLGSPWPGHDLPHPQ
ncbi:hypothetical protein SNOUR_42325 [Streptomyces noursei ATCC 11455]|nr:hypothetical protein SNOUR_42325 [Streptomyces noursei ATCC 11455]